MNEVLDGDDTFLKVLQGYGFQRVQINATAINGVDTSNLANSVASVVSVVSRFPDIEFILQKNEETRPLWEGVLLSPDAGAGVGRLPSNVTMLLDESKGTGTLSESFPSPPMHYEVGYAGGIGPANIEQVLSNVVAAANGRSVWIDMESSLRSNKNGMDVFDLDKCFTCISAVCAAKLHHHPAYLPS